MAKLPFNLNLKKNKSKNSILAIDLGSQTIKCALLKVDEERPNIVQIAGLEREWLEPGSVRGGYIVDTENVIKTCDSVIFKTTESLEEDIDDVVFGIGGDVCISFSTTARINRGTKAPVSQEELDEANKKILDASVEKAGELYYAKTGDVEENLEIITSATNYLKLDDKKYLEILDRTGTRMEMAIFNAFAPSNYLKELGDIAKALNLNILAVTPNSYAMTQILKKSKNNEDLDCVLLDIGNETTQATVIFGGGIVSTKTLAMGGKHFTQAISEELNVNFAEAERIKYDFSLGRLENGQATKVEIAIDRIIEIWLNGVEAMFTDFEDVKTFASKIYLTGGGSKLPLIMNSLENKPWTKSIPFRELPEYSKIRAIDFKGISDLSGNLDKEEFANVAALTQIVSEIRQMV